MPLMFIYLFYFQRFQAFVSIITILSLSLSHFRFFLLLHEASDELGFEVEFII